MLIALHSTCPSDHDHVYDVTGFEILFAEEAAAKYPYIRHLVQMDSAPGYIHIFDSDDGEFFAPTDRY